jgi:hypothetical protein
MLKVACSRVINIAKTEDFHGIFIPSVNASVMSIFR